MITYGIFAQDDLMNLLNENAPVEINFATATFKSTRIMNGHSIEKMPPGQLDFRISHRFGTVNSGAYEFFGLDQSNVHFSLEYGIFKWLMFGVGRGTYEKTFDGFTKFTVLRQSSGARVMPLSVLILALFKFSDLDNSSSYSFLQISKDGSFSSITLRACSMMVVKFASSISPKQ